MRAHLANMVKGVTDGWTRELEINGVGYRAEVGGDTLTMALGYSHPVVFKLPKGVGAKVDKNRIILTGADRDLLGTDRGQGARAAPSRAVQGQGREVRRRDHQEEGRQGGSHRLGRRRLTVARDKRHKRQCQRQA